MYLLCWVYFTHKKRTSKDEYKKLCGVGKHKLSKMFYVFFYILCMK